MSPQRPNTSTTMDAQVRTPSVGPSSSTSIMDVSSLNERLQGLEVTSQETRFRADSGNMQLNFEVDASDATALVPSPNPTPPFSTFHPFPRLATELRLKIWEAARPEARVIKISRGRFQPHVYYEPYSKAKVPAMLHTCSESREVAQHWYQLSFNLSPDLQPRIYFDHTRDWAYFQCLKCQGSSGRMTNPCPDGDACTLKCFSATLPFKRVAYEFCDTPGMVHDPFWTLLTCFPNAEEVLFINSEKGIGVRSEAKLMNFKCANWMSEYLNLPRIQGPNTASLTLMDAYRFCTEPWLGAPDERNDILKKITAVEYEDLSTPAIEDASE